VSFISGEKFCTIKVLPSVKTFIKIITNKKMGSVEGFKRYNFFGC
jgi:hypothetical protein